MTAASITTIVADIFFLERFVFELMLRFDAGHVSE